MNVGGATSTYSGALTLAGTNTYDGPTFINAGTLRVNRTNAVASGTGTFTVKTNATLGGADSAPSRRACAEKAHGHVAQRVAPCASACAGAVS